MVGIARKLDVEGDGQGSSWKVRRLTVQFLDV